MRILITGASGVLGRALVPRFSKWGDVTGVSRTGGCSTRACELSDAAEVGKLFAGAPYNLILHAAAYSDVDGCERDAARSWTSNAISTKLLAREAGRLRAAFLYISTDYVFDGRKKTPYLENDETAPVNVYGMTKLAGEYFASQCASASAVVRTSWLFGEGNPNNFVNAVIERLKSEKIVRVLDDQEDAPTYAEDLAAALEKIARHLLSPKTVKGFQGMFQVCNSGSATRHAMTLKIRDFLGLKNVRVEKLGTQEIPNRMAIRPAHCVMACGRYERLFHTRLRSWEESLKEYITTCIS